MRVNLVHMEAGGVSGPRSWSCSCKLPDGCWELSPGLPSPWLLLFFFNELIIKAYLILISNISNVSIDVTHIRKRFLGVLTDFPRRPKPLNHCPWHCGHADFLWKPSAARSLIGQDARIGPQMSSLVWDQTYPCEFQCTQWLSSPLWTLHHLFGCFKTRLPSFLPKIWGTEDLRDTLYKQPWWLRFSWL